VGPQNRSDDMERRKLLPLPRLELRSLGYPARSQLLYQLRYPGSSLDVNISKYLFLILLNVYNTDGCFAPRQTGRLTVGRNIRLRLIQSEDASN
jgi:hypothetical protein